MINLYIVGEKVFVWNAEDIMILRKNHRIVGSLIGIYPSKRFQVQTKWLPLQLMPEEAKLLVDKEFAKLLLSPDKITDPNLIESYLNKREELCDKQIALFKEKRKQEILDKADEIYAGKIKKYKKDKSKPDKKNISNEDPFSSVNSNISINEKSMVDELTPVKEVPDNKQMCCDKGKTDEDAECSSNSGDGHNLSTEEGCKQVSESQADISSSDSDIPDKQTVINDAIHKIPEVSKDVCMIQLFTECPWKSKSADGKLPYPSSEKEKLRCAVFKDLWEKQYYITSGTKFGGDFLAYEGDPLKYHAAFIIVCILPSTKLQALDILTYGRLGHQVKKTVVLASLNDSGVVEYISTSWANDLS